MPKLADDCRHSLSQIIDELIERGMPILEKALALLSQLRGPINANPEAAGLLGFELRHV